MIDALKPYSEMKDSGIPWLNAIPAHWDIQRNGRLFGLRKEVGYPELPILEVSIRSGVRRRDVDNGSRKQFMADRSQYQRAVRGDTFRKRSQPTRPIRTPSRTPTNRMPASSTTKRWRA